MRGAVAIITRLRAEGRLHPSWKTEEAAALLWALTSFSVWDDLASEIRGRSRSLRRDRVLLLPHLG